MVSTSENGHEQTTGPLLQARQLLSEGMLEEALKIVKAHWLNHPTDHEAVSLFGQILEEAGRPESAKKIKGLGQALSNTASDGTQPSEQLTKDFFEAGFALTDVRQYELGTLLLQRCHTLSPDEPVVNYELAFSLMSLNRFEEAIPYFQLAKKQLNDFDTNLNLGVCYTMTRNIKQAQKVMDELGQFVTADDERKELAHRKTVLRRLEQFGQKAAPNQRDWMYALYGTMLLRPDVPLKQGEDHKSIATTALILRGVLEGLRVEVEGIEYYNPVSKPLARLLSELMELPLDSYRGPDRPDSSLLVMAWATDLIGPHNSFVDNSDRRTLFAYGLSPKEPLPVMPDIIARLSEESLLPRDDKNKPEVADRIVDAVLAKARDLESNPEVLRQIQEAIQYYDLKRPVMVLNNPQSFPERPEYTAEVP